MPPIYASPSQGLVIGLPPAGDGHCPEIRVAPKDFIVEEVEEFSDGLIVGHFRRLYLDGQVVLFEDEWS